MTSEMLTPAVAARTLTISRCWAVRWNWTRRIPPLMRRRRYWLTPNASSVGGGATVGGAATSAGVTVVSAS